MSKAITMNSFEWGNIQLFIWHSGKKLYLFAKIAANVHRKNSEEELSQSWFLDFASTAAMNPEPNTRNLMDWALGIYSGWKLYYFALGVLLLLWCWCNTIAIFILALQLSNHHPVYNIDISSFTHSHSLYLCCLSAFSIDLQGLLLPVPCRAYYILAQYISHEEHPALLQPSECTFFELHLHRSIRESVLLVFLELCFFVPIHTALRTCEPHYLYKAELFLGKNWQSWSQRLDPLSAWSPHWIGEISSRTMQCMWHIWEIPQTSEAGRWNQLPMCLAHKDSVATTQKVQTKRHVRAKGSSHTR